MKVKLSIVCLLAIAAFVICVGGAPANEDKIADVTSSVPQVRAGFSPAKLFDFKNYKAVFHKTYSGMLEELVRAKYFLSRAFHAFVSAMRYKYRQSPFYLAVNHMSDWTPQEIEKSQNKLLAEVSEARRNKSQEGKNVVLQQYEPESDLPELLPENVEEAEKELSRMADGFSASSPHKTHDGKVRDLPMEKLIDTGADAKLDPRAARKLTNRVPSNNRNYEPLELPSFGLRDQSEGVDWWVITTRERVVSTGELKGSVGEALSELQKGVELEKEAEREQLPDKVFVDLRRTGCLTMPREQGTCGSCWAFAATAIFEYIYCMKTGQLVPFSEQYMIDCGKPYFKGANGCDGGYHEGPADFVKNFGLELRTNYPYNMRENMCPYEESTDLRRTGYIRFGFDDGVEIEIDLWPKYIKNSPLFVGMSWLPSFNAYGGGVFGWGCPRESSHAVALVGHGREDGHEYWLIRNSLSPDWGEGGYGKLAIRADCITDRVGFTFATDDGSNLRPEIRRNVHNDPRVVMSHQMRNMRM